ncbi:MAG: right-handed parallel beta-helix repeat-containing protein [Deltaproteobacteria bacterium]|nr:right-handed parallel beta-helix repeat-containing protein [Deltaproteobacteria bacterium]
MKSILRLFVAMLTLSVGSSALAQTDVPAGTINSDQIWAVTGSPYRIGGDVTVLSGVTLTVEAGVRVEFAAGADSQASGLDASLAELRIEGHLQVDASAVNPAVFASQSASPVAGDFYGIVFLAGATGEVSGARVEYGEHGIHLVSAGAVNLNDCEMDSCEIGLWIESCAPVVSGGSVHDCVDNGVYLTTDASAELAGLSVFGNGDAGIYLRNSSPDIHHCQVYDNSGHGIYTYNNLGTHEPHVIQNTVAYNSGSGLYFWENNYTLSATVRDNVVVSNSSYGIYSYYTSVSADHNLVWGHGTDYQSVTAGLGAMSENPLFVDALGRDLTPSSHSPARLHASAGTDLGALAYAGDITPVLAGHFYTNTILAAGVHNVVGDLTVEPGVTLTIAPGAELQFAAGADLMGGGLEETLCELRVLGRLIADGTESTRVVLGSDAAGPVSGDWYGVWLSDSSTGSLIDYAAIRHAKNGVHCEAPAGNVVQRSEIHDCSNDGLHLDNESAATFEDLVVRDNASDGIFIRNASPNIRRCQVHDNAGHGIYAYNNSGTHESLIEFNTVAFNSGSGLYFWENNYTLSATVRDNVVVSNSSYGIYSYYTSVSADHNLVWGHDTNYQSVTAGTGAMSENPLFADELIRDLRLTSNSPARLHASGGGDMGALAYTDNLPTVGLRGHLYDSVEWTAAGGPFVLLGDVTVEAGVTLTIGAGSEIRVVANSDDMGGNEDVDLVELRVLGRLVVAGTGLSPVTFRSDSGTPSAGHWYGLHFYPSASSSSVSKAIIEHAKIGIWSQADSTNLVGQSEVAGASSHGLQVDGGDPVFDGLLLHACGGSGAYVSNADPDLINLVAFGNSNHGVYVYNNSGTHHTDILHATISDNGGSGVYAWENNYTLSVDLNSSIVTNNSSYGLYSYYTSFSEDYNNVWGHGTDRQSVSIGANSRSDNPNFVDTSLGNYHLLEISTLIDQADPASTSISDAEGATRPIDGNNSSTAEPDMGAYEYNPDANKWPIAEAGPDRVVQEGENVTFDGSGSYDPDGTVVNYAWDFGDGQFDSGAVVQHAFSGGTDRNVTLTVTDDDGAIDVDVVFVEVNLAPVADTGPSDAFADVGEDIRFDGTGSTDSDGSIVRYDWAFGNGDHATGLVVFYQYASSGDYTVTLTVTDDDGGVDSDTMIAHVLGSVDAQPPQIVHSVVADGQAEGQAVAVQATVTDNMGVASVRLYYRTQGQPTYSVVDMPGAGGQYSASIPAGVVQLPAVDYYIEAQDTAATPNLATHPDNAPTMRHSFSVADLSPPSIIHEPVAPGQPVGQAVVVTANITDPSGVASATLHYRVQSGGSFVALGMSASGDTYSASMPGAAVQAPGMEYYIAAVDSSAQANAGFEPASAPGSVLTFSVQEGDGSAPSISVSQLPDGQQEDVPVLVEATITDSSGVDSATLYYRMEGGGLFVSAPMADQTGGVYSAEIPAASVRRPGVEYYVAATDASAAGNSGTSPADAPGTWFHFSVVKDFQLAEGDLVITEIMADPSAVSDTLGEWFELYNPTAADIDLNGLNISDNDSDGFTVDGQGQPVWVTAGGFLVLGRSADAQLNGGVTVDYVYSGFTLANNADEIVIWAGEQELDRVEYDSVTFPLTSGASMGLDPDQTDAMANDDSANWCVSESLMSGGDAGTPGASNDACVEPEDNESPLISHNPIGDGQPAGLPVGLVATVSDASGLDQVTAYARVMGGGGFTAITMSSSGGDSYQGNIPAGLVTVGGVEYYIEAVDASPNANEASLPVDGASAPYAFTVTVSDEAGPSIQHTPVAGPVPEGVDLEIRTTVSDPSGVAEVNLYVSIAGLWAEVPMVEETQGVYVASFPGSSVLAPQVSYYITASDASPASNLSSLPEGGQAAPFVVAVELLDEEGPVIVHTPIADGQPAGEDVLLEAQVTDSAGVDSVMVYFRAAGTSVLVGSIMTSADGEWFSGTIPAALVQQPGVEYYLEASDASDSQNVSRDPAGAPGQVHSFMVAGEGDDVDGPVIVHTPVSDGAAIGLAVNLEARVTDASGVAQVNLYYRVLGAIEDFTLVIMDEDGAEAGHYLGSIPAEAVTEQGVEYYLEAFDSAPLSNQSSDPADAPTQVHSFMPGTEAGDGGCGCGQTGGTAGSGLFLLGLLFLAWRRR